MGQAEYSGLYDLTGPVARTLFALSHSEDDRKRYDEAIKSHANNITFKTYCLLLSHRRAEINDDEMFFKFMTLYPRKPEYNDIPRYQGCWDHLPEQVCYMPWNLQVWRIDESVYKRFPLEINFCLARLQS
jgi:hypothetical protein